MSEGQHPMPSDSSDGALPGAASVQPQCRFSAYGEEILSLVGTLSGAASCPFPYPLCLSQNLPDLVTVPLCACHNQIGLTGVPSHATCLSPLLSARSPVAKSPHWPWLLPSRLYVYLQQERLPLSHSVSHKTLPHHIKHPTPLSRSSPTRLGQSVPHSTTAHLSGRMHAP